MRTLKFGKLTIVVLTLTAFLAFKGEKDKLHKRFFTIDISEPKKPKTTPDELQFKDGKVWCGDVISEKLDLKLIRYELVKDSTYMDEDTEVEYIEVLATTEMEKGESFEFKCVIDNYQIEGGMRHMKNGKDKKTWSFTGKEKVKPEKDKKKK
ncbi:MAG: hypothetical protein IPG89_03535 [Bacteroidetes bacterium]|nr:hypothetical protein [Bacteroidota bacterium]